jgi:hypothetical protein
MCRQVVVGLQVDIAQSPLSSSRRQIAWLQYVHFMNIWRSWHIDVGRWFVSKAIEEDYYYGTTHHFHGTNTRILEEFVGDNSTWEFINKNAMNSSTQ